MGFVIAVLWILFVISMLLLMGVILLQEGKGGGLAEAFGGVGLRAETVDQVDDVIREMIDTPTAVICDVRVDRAENVYPMIPGGAAHNDIRLSPDDDDGPVQGSEDGMVLV